MTALLPEALDERYELGQSQDPAVYMEAMLGRAVMWLGEVQKIEDVINHKAATEAIKTFIREKELGRDAELAAAEIVRRCERRIAQLVRLGQERKEIRQQGESIPHTGRALHELPKTVGEVLRPEDPRRGRFEAMELSPLAKPTDDEFNEAIAQAKTEENLSRANVIRKIKGEPAPTNGRSEWHRKTRHIDLNRAVREMAITLDGLASTIALVDATAVDKETVDQWADSMKQSLRVLTRFIKELTCD